MPASACYREFVPGPALRECVRAFFTFSMPAAGAGVGRRAARQILLAEGQRTATPLFADGHTSIVFSFGNAYRVDGLWAAGGPSGHAIGAMSQARLASHGDGVIQVGAYLRAARARELLGVPACDLTDRITALNDLWIGTHAEEWISKARTDCDRVNRLEQILVQRLEAAPPRRLDTAGLAAHVFANAGRRSVEQLAWMAGVSRQSLTRAFREDIGVSPKLYSRLARFRAALARMSSPPHEWAEVAADLGYSDQSHLIADFKQFSGLTPAAMAVERRFHPFAG